MKPQEHHHRAQGKLVMEEACRSQQSVKFGVVKLWCIPQNLSEKNIKAIMSVQCVPQPRLQISPVVAIIYEIEEAQSINE